MFDALAETLKARPRRALTRPRAAAVLIPVVDDGGPLRVVLTRRTDHLSSHSGHVAYPGGRRDPEDVDLTDTALREAEEEVALGRQHVEVIGWLDDLPTVHNDTTVTPVVGRIQSLPTLKADPGEVARIFEIELAELMKADRWRMEMVEKDGHRWPLYFFDHDGETLWGLSAYITLQFLDLTSLGAPFKLPEVRLR